MYLNEVTPTKGERARKHDRAAAAMFIACFGSNTVVSGLNLRDWERFIQHREAGRLGPGEGPWCPVAARTVERDLPFLLAVLNWATMAGDGTSGVLLQRNPFKGYRPPKEKNPLRVSLTSAEYTALLGIARKVDWRFHVALVVAHETGHRIGAIRALRWSDVDLSEGLILWRAEHEKTGYEHETPISEKAREALETARRYNPGIGDSPVLPAPTDPSRPVSRNLVRDWWPKAERLAQLEPKRGRGWHSLRRKFASDLKGAPLKTLCQLGGWRSHHTVLICYQRADETEMREALQERRRA